MELLIGKKNYFLELVDEETDFHFRSHRMGMFFLVNKSKRREISCMNQLHVMKK